MLSKKITVLLFIILNASCRGKDEQDASVLPNESLINHLKESVAKYPDSLQVIEKLIEYYRDNGKYDSALVLTDNAIKRDSQVAELWDIKATLHFENSDTLNSIKSLEHAIRIYPLPEYIISLGTIYAQIKNPKAIELADALIIGDKSKAHKEAIFIKGLYYTYSGNKKMAIKLFDSCINIEYTYMFAYREKAIALYDLGDYEEALKVLTKAVTIQNNFDEGYFWMGKVYEKLNRKQEAIESYQTSLMYDKDFTEAKESLKRLGAR